jgi:5-methylcytosine-specific restriction endonuclease McrA
VTIQYSAMVAPIPREELLSDLKRVASELGEPPTKSQYKKHGTHSVSTIYREFGGMSAAREAAGLDGSDQRGGQNKATREALLNAIRDLQDELGRPPRREEMLEVGEFSETPFRREFGSWGEAVVAAGYEPHRPSAELAQRVTCTCAWCGETDEVLASQLENQDRWYCSRKCKHDWQAENVVGEDHHQYDRRTVTCNHCGESFDRKPAVAESRDRHFCDYDCYGEWCSVHRTEEMNPRWQGGEVEKQCEICGESFSVKQAKASNSRFCSYDCLGTAREEEMSGEGNPNWVAGTTGYYGPNWDEQRQKRLRRDDHACIVCGLTREEHYREFGQDLIVHHVIPRRKFVTEGKLDAERANRVSNLRTMCVTDHQRWEGIPVAPD